MIKRNITFTNLMGEDVTEPYYFHLSPGQIAEVHIETEGGLSALFDQDVLGDDKGKIVRALKKIVAMSAGRQSEDGTRFIRDPEFVNTLAYDALFYELVTESDEAAKFVNGVFPPEVLNKMKTDLDKLEGGAPTTPGGDLDLGSLTPEQIEQIREMQKNN